MSHIANSIFMNESKENGFTGGYDINMLLNNNNNQTGGNNEDVKSKFDDLLIPLGLYYNNTVTNDFYKIVKSNVIDDKMFDNLFDLVSKSRNKPTRKNIEQIKPNKVTKRQNH